MKAPLIALSMIAAFSLSAQCQSLETNAPLAMGLATANLQMSRCWDLYSEVTFTFWQPLQKNMEVAMINDTTPVPGVSSLSFNADTLQMSSNFKPGFIVALGLVTDHDDWDARLQYTWFRSSQSASKSLDPAGAFYLMPIVAAQTPALISLGTFTSVHSQWHINMDLADLEIGRNTYFGSKLALRPFAALRASWIRQKFETDFVDLLPGQNTFLNNFGRSHCWGLGPRIGLNTNWMLGKGASIYGNAGGDILYTQYTSLFNKSDSTNFVTDVQSFSGFRQNNLGSLRAHIDLELGIAWGSYFACNTWHIDLAAGYIFQAFFDQNMLRNFLEFGPPQAYSVSPTGDLYLQGLTASVRLDY